MIIGRERRHEEGKTIQRPIISTERKKENSKDNTGEPYDGTVGGVPKYKLEPKGDKPGNTMVCKRKTYYWWPSNHGRGMWGFHRTDKQNIKENQVETNTDE